MTSRSTFVDPAQFDTALLNLALNARDAMPEGGRLTIETSPVELDADYAAVHPEVTPGPYVLIAVSDTGTGIPPEDIERVFEPFFSSKGAGKGTGLGLSMVHGFVKQSGGHIKLYSEVGHGTTVRLYLPPAAGPVLRKQAPPEPAPELAATETILLVEDDELVLRYVQRTLRSFGYTVVTAANGTEALPVLESDREFDLLFTDVIMTGELSGAELARKARDLRPGSFVGPNRPLALIGRPESGASIPARELALLRQAWLQGENRSFDQDPRIGLCVLAEVATKALSDGVNDVGTAIGVLGRLVRVFGGLEHARDEGEDDGRTLGVRHDNIMVEPIKALDALNDAFRPIARDGAGAIELGLRLQATLAHVARLRISDAALQGSMSEAAAVVAADALARARLALSSTADVTALEAAASHLLSQHGLQCASAASTV